MDHSRELLGATLAVLACLALIVWVRRRRRTSKEQSVVDGFQGPLGEAGRAAAQSELDGLCPEVLRLCEEIARLTAYDSGYLMRRDWDRLLVDAGPVLTTLSTFPPQVIEASESASQIAYLEHRQYQHLDGYARGSFDEQAQASVPRIAKADRTVAMAKPFFFMGRRPSQRRCHKIRCRKIF